MKRYLLILVCLVCVGSAQAASIVFEDDFAGTGPIDPTKWNTVGTVTQDDVLNIAGSAAWETDLVTNKTAANSIDDGNNLTWSVDNLGGGAATLSGLYDAASYIDYQNSTIYGWHYVGGATLAVYAMQGGTDFGTYVGVPSDNFRARITLGTTIGALWEYSIDNGANWVALRDTRDIADGGDGTSTTTNTGKDWNFYLMANVTPGPKAEFDNAMLFYGDVDTAPYVDAGSAQQILASVGTTQMDATVVEGVPTNATLTWSKITGPGTAIFDDDTAEDPKLLSQRWAAMCFN